MDPLKATPSQVSGSRPVAGDADAQVARVTADAPDGLLRQRQTVAPQAAPPAEKVSDEQVRRRDAEANAQKLQALTQNLRRELKFQVAGDGRTIIEVLDADTGDVIRTIPPEEQSRVLRALEQGDVSLLDSEA
jgi:flagellar protein FlaG